MLAIVQKDWTSMSPERQISMLKKLKPDMLCNFVRKLDVDNTDMSVIRWIAARKELDLGTALTLFFAFHPRRWNLLPRNAFPENSREVHAVLDVLCQRINCGFYLPIAARQMRDPAQVADWLAHQREDARIGRRGRWVFDAKILAPVIADAGLAKNRKPKALGGHRHGFIQGLFTPLFVPGRQSSS